MPKENLTAIQTSLKGFERYLRLIILLFPVFLLMSFINDPTKNPGNDETGKDSTKGFKTLLGNTTLNEDGTTILFELNPRMTVFTNDYLLKQGDKFEKMKLWGQPYFLIYEKILANYALPLELKYLSVVESDLKSGAISVAGAAGPWQLMPSEAKRFGLKVSAAYDERTNFSKSTVAAARLLKELYTDYNDWLLVIAAYNCGRGNVNKAITKAHSRNFYELEKYLPEETRNHVKKYIATHYYFEGGCGWTTLSASETTEKKEALAYLKNQRDSVVVANTINIDLTGKYNSVVLSNTILMAIDEFNKLNPYFDKYLLAGKTYTLKLPQEKAALFKAKKQQILYESVQLFLTGGTVQPIALAADKPTTIIGTK